MTNFLRPVAATALRKSGVEPGVHGGPVDDVVVREQLGHFRHERTRERILGDRREHGRNLEQLRRLGEDLDVVEEYQAIVRLHALIHGGLIVDQGDGAVLRGEHLEFGHL